MKRLKIGFVVLLAVATGCCKESGTCSCAEVQPKISVFTHYIRSVAKQRGISLSEAADLLYGLGIRGFDIGPTDKDLPALATTKLKPINFYYFPDWYAAGTPAEEKGDVDATPPTECLKLAKHYGIPRIMVVPPNFPNGKEDAAEIDRLVVLLKNFVAEAKTFGITVTVEDFGGTKNPCSYAKYITRFLTEIPDLKLALDSGNLYYARRGEDILELMDFAKDRIAHIHLKDQLPSDQRTYAELGLGGVPNEKIVKTMNVAGYDGWYTLENTVVGTSVYYEAVRQVAILKTWLRESACTGM